MRPINRSWVLAAAIFALAGCAQLGLAPAKNFDQRLAYAQATHTAILQAAASAAEAGTLTRADAGQVLALADQSESLIMAAKNIEQTNAGDAASKLALAAAILTELQEYLKAKGVK